MKSFPVMRLVCSRECLLLRVNHPGAARESRESSGIQREADRDEWTRRRANRGLARSPELLSSAAGSSASRQRRDAVFRSTGEQTGAETVRSSGLETRTASWRMAQYRLLVAFVRAHVISVARAVNQSLSTVRPRDERVRRDPGVRSVLNSHHSRREFDVFRLVLLLPVKKITP